MTLAAAPLRPARTVASGPYLWPFHGELRPGGCALVACLDPRWRRAGADSDACDERLGRLAAGLSAVGGLVVAVTSVPGRPTGSRTEGAASAASSPTPFCADHVVEAGGTSALFASDLDTLLRTAGCTDLLIAGWGLEGPVHSTLRAANDRGYECLLVADACIPVRPDLTGAACSMVRMSGGIFGAVAVSSAVLSALAQLPTHHSTPRVTTSPSERHPS